MRQNGLTDLEKKMLILYLQIARKRLTKQHLRIALCYARNYYEINTA